MTKSEDNLDFLYYGDIWQALLGNKQHNLLPKIICEGIQKGSVIKAVQNFSFLEYRPRKSLISYITIIQHTIDKNIFYSGFPFLTGLENDLICYETRNESVDDVEGYVLLKKGDAAEMWMYNPLYGQQKDLLQSVSGKNKKEQKFYIAGIGWNIKKNIDSLIKINEGPTYELLLKEFLDNNPDKTKDDFPYAEFDTSHISLLAARDCADMYEFASDIFNITTFKYYGLEFYCFEIEVLRETDDSGAGMRVNLYVNKNSLGNYKPQIGDNIMGFMQLTAYINQKPDKENGKQKSFFRLSNFWGKIRTLFS